MLRPGRMRRSPTARKDLAEQINVDPSVITMVSVEAVDWPDGCLGVQTPGVMCTHGDHIGLSRDPGGQRQAVRISHECQRRCGAFGHCHAAEAKYAMSRSRYEVGSF